MTVGVASSQGIDASNSDGEAWALTQQTGTAAAYSEFILTFPQSAYVATALCALQEMGLPIDASEGVDINENLAQIDLSECALTTASSSHIINV